MELSLESIETKKPSKLPPRVGIYGVGGVGKTSIAAMYPKPVFIQSPGETGLETLMSANQLPPTGRFPVCTSTDKFTAWDDMLDQVDVLFKENHKYKTLVLDTAPGFLRCLHEHVCHKDYKDDWGPYGFGSYKQGERECTPVWHKFLLTLDKLRERKGMTIVLLAHAEIRNFKNPEGPDYDRYKPDMPGDDWTKTFGWLDMVLFMNFVVEVKQADKGDRKHVATGGTKRAFFTEGTGPYDAKGGRYGLPPKIDVPNNPADAYKVLVETVRKASEPKTQEKKQDGSDKTS